MVLNGGEKLPTAYTCVHKRTLVKYSKPSSTLLLDTDSKPMGQLHAILMSRRVLTRSASVLQRPAIQQGKVQAPLSKKYC